MYQAVFETEPGTWSTVELSLAEVEPRLHGWRAAGTLDLAHVSSLGLLFPDWQAGPFRHEVETIAGRNGETPITLR